MEQERVTQSTSPYREIFSILESHTYETSDAYTVFYDWAEINGVDPCVYLSSAITSGGLARDPDISFSEMMQAHTEFGDRIAHAIASQESNWYISRHDIVAPADLGKVPGWGQADYLLFWAHVITGIDPREAERVDADVRQKGITELKGFYDKTLSREDKWNDYSALIDAYVDALEKFDSGKGDNGMNLPRNIQAVVPILDASESLGVNAERYLCHKLGFGEYNLNLQDEHLHNHTIQLLERMMAVGAQALERSRKRGVISGTQNTEAYWQQRERGVRWRSSGFRGIYERRSSEGELVSENAQTNEQLKLSQAEMWAVQFDSVLIQDESDESA